MHVIYVMAMVMDIVMGRKIVMYVLDMMAVVMDIVIGLMLYCL